MMTLICDVYHKVLLAILGLLVGTIIIPVTLQITARYTPLIPTYLWTEEVARFCLVWMILIGSAVGVREGTHFDVDIWKTPTTPRGLLLSRLSVKGIVLLFAAIFLYGAYDFADFGMMMLSEITQISLGYVYIAFPIAAAGWILFGIEGILKDIRTYREAHDASGAR